MTTMTEIVFGQAVDADYIKATAELMGVPDSALIGSACDEALEAGDIQDRDAAFRSVCRELGISF